ncbi:MAG TPA: hypothetical protein VJ783_19130 [Pirellulales bacterium]|nr:hypothetical protein [Pirellulales bacterium]
MCRESIFLATIGFVLLPAAIVAAPPTVGDMAAIDRLDIAGSHFASPDRLKQALDHDLEFLLACDPAAPLDEFLAVVARRLAAGYHRAGFAKARVDARPNLQTRRVAIRIDEGPRFRAGEVRLAGAAPLSAGDLLAWLRAPPAAASEEQRIHWQPENGLDAGDSLNEKPIWLPGEPARISAWSRRQLLRQVQLAFAERGFFFPKLSLEIVPSREAAQLVIEVRDQGPPGFLGSIEVVGLQRNSPEHVLRYLNLAAGQHLDRAELARLQARLYESARFAYIDAQPVAPEAPGGPIKLVLKLIETPDAPPLDRPFSAEEQAMLKLRAWLMEQVGTGRDDLTVSLRDTTSGLRTARLVLSARGGALRLDVSDPGRALGDGVLSRLRKLTGMGPKEPPAERTECLLGLELTQEAAVLYSPLRQRKIAMAPGNKQLGLRLTLRPDPRQPRRLAVSLDPRVHTRSAAQAQPVALELDLAPAACVALAHLGEAPAKVEQGVLRIEAKSLRLEADAASGRLLRAEVHDDRQTQQASVNVAHGQLQRAAAELRRASGGYRNDYDPRRPDAALASFSICELAHLSRAWEGLEAVGDTAGLDVWQGLLNTYLLPDLGGEPAAVAKRDEYFIPTEPSSLEHPPRNENAMWLAVGPLGFCHRLFPAESWPCRLSRASVFYLAGRDAEARDELTRVDRSDRTGPLGYLACTLASLVIEPALTRQIAAHGLEKTAISNFRRDYLLLLESRGDWVPSALAGIKQLSRLERRQIESAVGVLPKPLSEFVADWAGRLQELPDAPTDVVLAGLLDDYWESGLRLRVRLALVWLSEMASPAPNTAKARTKTKAK